MIPETTIAEILERADIVQVVGRTVALRKAGTLFKGLCPFHDEKSPSFTVSPVRRSYHCFGCGVHGDALRFLIEQGGLTFLEAVRELAAEVGIEVPNERPPSPAVLVERTRQKTEAERLFAAQDALTTWYTEALFGPHGEPARRYLQNRGVSVDAARAFRLGYADGDATRLAAFAQTAKIDAADLVTLGILIAGDDDREVGPLGRNYPRFRRRLMCPVLDVRGRVTGYSGRVIDANAKGGKYVNSPETPIFIKGEQLYGAHTARGTARRAGRVLLCEGNLDVVALWQAGFPGTVAAMGTALTARQVRLIKRLADDVVCVMDGDAAGLKAAFGSLLPFLEEGIQPRAVMLSGGHDPDSYLRAHGPDAFRTLLEAARPLFDLTLEREAATHPADALGRIAALRAIAPALRLVTDPLAQDLYRQQVCTRLGVPADLLERALKELEAPEPRPAAATRPGELRSEAAHPRESRPAVRPRGEAPMHPEAHPGHLEGRSGPRSDLPGPEGPWDEPPPWADAPDDPGALEAAMDATPARPARRPGGAPGPTGTDSAARSRTKTPMPTIPRYERELAEYIADFPMLAVDFVQREGTKYLTHSGLADFLVRLCREVESGAVLDEDRLLREFPDAQVVAFWRERQARRSGLDPERARRALHDGLLLLEQGHLRRQRDDVLQRIRTSASVGLVAELAEINRQLALIARRLSTPTTQPPAQGAN